MKVARLNAQEARLIKDLAKVQSREELSDAGWAAQESRLAATRKAIEDLRAKRGRIVERTFPNMRINVVVSNITAGTPVNLAVALGLVANNAALATSNPILVNRIDVEMGFGGTVGVGYYMDLGLPPWHGGE